MKLLLTSNGITNPSIYQALVDLLGKPITASDALFIPTAIYPFSGSPGYAMQAIHGRPNAPLSQLGWRSLGLLELSALPSIEKDIWLRGLQQADALLFWGGDPFFLVYWLQASGLAAALPSLFDKLVYVGVSAGSMATSKLFGEAYTHVPGGLRNVISSEEVFLGDIRRTLQIGYGAGFVDFALIPHFCNPNHPDASLTNAEAWAKKLPVPVYAIDDQTAIKVVDNSVEVISEGMWKLFNFDDIAR